VLIVDSPQYLKLELLKNLAPGSIICRRFSDIDEFTEFLPEDVRLIQLERQPFTCDSRILLFDAIRFNFNHANCKVQAVGDKYSGFLAFAFILHSQGQPAIEDNRLVTPEYVFGFDPNREANLVFPGNATHCAVHIRQDLFEACIESMDRLDLNTQFIASNHVYIAESLPPLQVYLQQLYELLHQQSPLLCKPDFQQIILRDFLPLFITALPIQHERLKPPLKAFRRSHLVKQANDYMQTHIDQPLTLTHLCEALGTSSRALCYGFQEMFGMSPMSYLKILRLQSVHRALKLAGPEYETVTEIASQFGFYHLGYFAHDYKQMFGELPSATWRRGK
jgi:AraC family ethanolamine operon transcriptional activator